MCGIVAILSPEKPISRETVSRATQALRHRGPDGQKQWISGDGKVALGHARLSIIDLTTGDQPIANEDGRLRMVQNGEFYGYEAIQSELERAGHRLRTRTDSEIALHLYEDVGAQCLHRLRGEFAFVIWDEANKSLFAARDRFGIKPLFGAMHEGTLYLASEVKALFAAGVPARWDHEGLYHSLDLGWHQLRTLYHGVFQVPAGHYMVATRGHIQFTRYWDFDYPVASGRTRRTDREYVDEFRAALDESVRVRLRADVPVGCYLSGGLDSCSVLGLAAKHHPQPIRAFTVAFDHPAYDEEEIAKEMASRVGADFSSIRVTQDDLADNFEDATAQSESLCFNAHGVAKFLLSRSAQAAGYKVVLTGEGSDEVLGGYAHFRRDMIVYNSEGQDASVIAALRTELDRVEAISRDVIPRDDSPRMAAVRKLLGYVPSWIESFAVRGVRMRPLLSPGFLGEFGDRDGLRSLFNELDIQGQLTGRDPVDQSLYLWSKTILPSYILPILADRMEMGHGIEGRLPFLDHKVVEVLRSFPVNLKIRGMTVKYVLREATRDVLTETAYARQKHAFVSPPGALIPWEKMGTLVQDTLRSKNFASIPFFDQAKVVALLDGLEEMDATARIVNDQVLMLILSASVLQQRFKLAA